MANLGFNQLQRFHVEFGDVAVAKAADGAAPADRGPPPLPLLPPQRRRAGRLLPGRDLRRPRRLPTAHQNLKPSPLPGGESRRRGNNFIPHIPLFILSSQSLFKKIYCYIVYLLFSVLFQTWEDALYLLSVLHRTEHLFNITVLSRY